MTTAVSTIAPGAITTDVLRELPKSPGVWAQAWKRLKNDRVGIVSFYITLFFVGLVLLTVLGFVGKNWQQEVGTPFAPPHFIGKIVDRKSVV